MKLLRCKKGHYYNGEEFEECPHCNISKRYIQCERGHIYDKEKYNECPECKKYHWVGYDRYDLSNASIAYRPSEQARLSIYGETGDFVGKNYSLYTGQFCIIGRSEESDIQLKSQKISRCHCILEAVSEDVCKIMDVSSNGIFCDGIKLLRKQFYFIEIGSQIGLSDETNTFRIIRNKNAQNQKNIRLGKCPRGHIYDIGKHWDVTWDNSIVDFIKLEGYTGLGDRYLEFGHSYIRNNRCPVCKCFFGENLLNNRK